MSNRGIITKALKNRNPESKRYIDLNVDIATRIQDVLDAKGSGRKNGQAKFRNQQMANRYP